MRAMIEYIRNKRIGVLRGAEVGVSQGDNAIDILWNLPMEKLYLIDPYKLYFEEGYLQKQVLLYKNLARHRLSEYDNVDFIYRKSVDASKVFKDNYLDFVYIDANHKQENVYEDIVSWYPKIKIGGVIGGHDFNDRHDGVLLGVLQFIDEYQLTLTDVRDDDWWIEK